MNPITSIDKLIEKCRKGDEKACEELKEYGKFLEERLKNTEYLLMSNLFAVFIILVVEKIIINVLTITMLIALSIFLILNLLRIHRLSKYITYLYEVLGDPTIPWKIDPLIIGGLIAGLMMAIAGILVALGILPTTI